MRPRRIILDIDDVLNSMTLFIMKQVFQCKVDVYDYDKFPAEVGYDIIAAVATLRDEDPIPVTEFWEMVPRGIWAGAPKSYECDWLIDKAADLVGQKEVFLATTPTKCAEAHAGKIDWINQFLPDWIHRQYFITPRKWLLGKPGVVLIDDHAENCALFEEEGGEAILLPRPWNPLHNRSLYPRVHVESQLKRLFGD